MEFPEHNGALLAVSLTNQELYDLAASRLTAFCKVHADSRSNSETVGRNLLWLTEALNAIACSSKSEYSHDKDRVIELKAHQKFELEIGLQKVEDMVATADGERFIS